MRTQKPLFILLLLTAAISTFAQPDATTDPGKPYIEVTGTVEKEIVPDEIYIAITIRERQDGKDKVTIEKQEADLNEALKVIGVPIENLSLSDANANYVSVNWSRKDVISSKEYMLKVGDATTLGKVFEKLDEIKIHDAYIARVSHSKLEEFKKQVRIMAIKAAKEKADYLLTAIGEQTGKALIVQEQSHSLRIDNDNLNISAQRDSRFGSEVTNEESVEKVLQFQKIKLQAALYVKFEIK